MMTVTLQHDHPQSWPCGQLEVLSGHPVLDTDATNCCSPAEDDGLGP
jgi:hypothetical protein